MPLIVTGSEGKTIYGTGSIVSETKQGEQKTEMTGSVIVSGSMLITGTLEVSGNTIHNYGNFYNISTNYADGNISGSGQGIFVKGVETAGDLNVSGNTVMSGNISMYGNYVGLALSSTLYNSHYRWAPAAYRSLLLYDYNSNYAIRVQNKKTYFGGAEIPTHTVHVGGDISGSGKIFNIGGIETVGSLGVSGSAQISGSVGIGATGAYVSASHPLSVYGDMSGSGKIFNLGGIETAGNLGVSGSVTVTGVASGTIAGAGSYLGVTSAGQLILAAASTHAGGSGGTITALNNQTESRLVTIGNTTTELDGEANLTYDGTTFVINDDARVNDDLPLYFGSNSDGSIMYQEEGNNALVISGSKEPGGGLVLSGSSIYIGGSAVGADAPITTIGGGVLVPSVASGTIAGAGSYLGVSSAGQLILAAASTHAGQSAPVSALNNKAESRLVTIGSTTSELDGEANLTYDGTTFVINDDARVNDDLPLYFGSNSDGSIMYQEDGNDALVVSGSKEPGGGLVLSGSSITIGGHETGVTPPDTTVRGGMTVTRMLTHLGDLSGSGKIFNVNGIETQGSLGVTGSLVVRGGSILGGAIVTGDLSGSGKILNVGGFETQGNIGVTGSAVVRGLTALMGTTTITADLSGSGKIFNVGGIQTQGDLGVTGSVDILGKVGIGTTTPYTALSVVHDYHGDTFENQMSDGQGGGDIIKYSPGSDDTLTVGQLYFLSGSGTWHQTDADAVATGASQLLGIGLGNARTVGVLIRGFARIPSTEILNLPSHAGGTIVDGAPVYVSTTAGHLDFTAPAGSGDFVRIVGYAIDDDGGDVLVYFDPDKTWVEVA